MKSYTIFTDNGVVHITGYLSGPEAKALTGDVGALWCETDKLWQEEGK